MRYIIFIFFIVLITACHKSAQRNEIIKVELAHDTSILNRGTIIDIDNSLNYNFYRFRRFWRHSDKDESFYYKGKIDRSFWDTLNSKFEKIKYKTLDTNQKDFVLDGERYMLIIRWKNGMKRITRVISSNPDSLIRVLDWLDSSYKRVKLKQTKSHYRFETTDQTPLPPLPKIDNVKFPPPTKQ